MKAGRKSYWDTVIKPRLMEIAGWARDGLTDKQIGEILGVSHETFCKYKRLKPEFVEALRVNKTIADLNVENSLYQRANGYTVTEVVEEVYGVPTGKKDKDGKPIIKYEKAHRRTVKKEIPPDTTAQIFWLKNRQPDKWRDRRVTEVSGINEEPITVVAKLDEEKYREIRKKMIEESDC